MIYLVLGAAILIIVWLLLQGVVATPPRQLIRIFQVTFALIYTGLAGYFLANGRVAAFLYVTIGAAILAMMILSLPRLLESVPTLWRGGSNAVTTRWLRVWRDRAGATQGKITDGPWKGRRLADLSLDEILSVLRESRTHDPDASAVLEAYLDHRFPDWCNTATEEELPRRAGSPMTRDEALKVLGLLATASFDEIHEAHRRLMMKLHPDHGGSDYFAAKLNEAKRVLVGE